MISENLSEFFGQPVVDYKGDARLDAPASTAYRIRCDWEDFDNQITFLTRFQALLEDPGVGEIQALVIGDWGGAGQGEDVKSVIESLVGAKSRLPNLKALFIGDMISEESEISWIEQDDLSPLWAAYPSLEEFGVRGGNGLSLGMPGELNLQHLRKLVIEAGGLPARVVRQIAAADLPQLEHLEVWLGTDEYGGNASVEDVTPILNATGWPKLTYLGLRNAEIADQIAAAIGDSSIVNQLHVLDLSLGTLTDKGAEALAAAGNLCGLQRLDVHHHFCTEAGINMLRETGCALDASDPQNADEYDGEIYYYVAVSE